MDNLKPHWFAQVVGTSVMVLGVGFLSVGIGLVGWGLVWLVIILASLNLFAGFCLGCAMYYWLNHLNLPGFHKKPPAGIGVFLNWLVNSALVYRARRAEFIVPGFRPGTPGILYFTTPECVPCKTVQRPALERL
jgi:hypothetical protein